MKSNRLSRKARWLLSSSAAAVVIFSAALLLAYNPFQDVSPVSNSATANRWDPSAMPVVWLLNTATPGNNVDVDGCTDTPANCIQTAFAKGFQMWTSTPLQMPGQTSVQLTNVTVKYGGAAPASDTAPDANDCQNVVGFSDSASDFSTGTIAFTQVADAIGTPPFTYTCSGGGSKTCSFASCISDADIEFNPGEKFTAATTNVPANTFSLQAIATHEEGHLLGLDHSGIGHAIMFPFGDTVAAGVQLALSTDDVIGMGFLYPSQSFSTATGNISGTVTLNGSGPFAAHVVAIETSTGTVVLDGLTNPDGTYKLTGVPPGNYQVLVLPLAPDDNSGIVAFENFSGWSCGYGENSPPCCDPSKDSSCTGTLSNETNYTGRFY